MRRSSTAGFLALALAAASLPAPAVSDVTVGRSENTATLDTATAASCQPTLVERFSRHAIVEVSGGPYKGHALLVQEFELGRGCFEGFAPARVKVSARPINAATGTSAGPTLYTFTSEGVSGEVQDGELYGTYKISMPGCCAAGDTSRYFSLQTGHLLLSSSGPVLEITFLGLTDSNQRLVSRLVSVEDGTTASPLATTKGVATIFFASREDMRQEVTVTGPAFKDQEWRLVGLGFSGLDAGQQSIAVNDSTRDSIKVRLACRCEANPIEIVLPFTADSLIPSKATITGAVDLVFKDRRF